MTDLEALVAAASVFMDEYPVPARTAAEYGSATGH
jgi:hypothetical protein